MVLDKNGILILNLSDFDKWTSKEKAIARGLALRFQRDPDSIPPLVVVTSNDVSVNDETLLLSLISEIPEFSILVKRAIFWTTQGNRWLRSDPKANQKSSIDVAALLAKLEEQGRPSPSVHVMTYSEESLDISGVNREILTITALKSLAQRIRHAFEKLRFFAIQA